MIIDLGNGKFRLKSKDGSRVLLSEGTRAEVEAAEKRANEHSVDHIDGVWTTAETDRFPDSSFLYVEAGGSKDSDGRTTPRSLRHFPVRDESGKLDLDHLRNAISQAPKSNLSEAVVSKVQAEGRKLLDDATKKTDHADVACGVARFDISELKPLRMTSEGWAIADGFIGRTGLLEYTRNGKKWVEYRPPDEAFNQDSLDSFDLVPLTNDHPPPNDRLHGARILDAENASRYAVGVIASPHRDGDMVRAKIRITDAAAIEDLKRGRSQLSCGYLADVDPTPGEIDGKRYDAIQRNVRGNHVALVSQGRAGPSARLRVDSFESEPVASNHGQGDHAMKIRIDGVAYEIECKDASFEQVWAKAEASRADEAKRHEADLAKAKADAAEAATNAKAEVDKITARADAAEAAVKAKTDELTKAPERIKAEMLARSKLVATGVEILGSEAKADGMKDADLKQAVILAVMPETKLDGKSEAYVDAMFDAAVTMSGRSALDRGTGPAVTADSRADAGKGGDDDDEEEDNAKQNDFQKKSRAAAKKGKTPDDDEDEDEDD